MCSRRSIGKLPLPSHGTAARVAAEAGGDVRVDASLPVSGPSAAGQTRSTALPECKTFQQWLDELNRKSPHRVAIRDYDGLDRSDLEKSLHCTPMTEREFQRKLARCTFNIKV